MWIRLTYCVSFGCLSWQAHTKFYDQLGSGTLKVDGISGEESGENLIKAHSDGFWQGSIPATWHLKLKEHYSDSKIAGDAPAVLLWLAEEERGIFRLAYWLSALISFLIMALFCAVYCGMACLGI